MGLQSLKEYLGTLSNVAILDEKKSKKKPGVLISIGGTFQAEDTKNKNNRVYPHHTWDAVFEDKDWREGVENKAVMGEVDHPKDGGALRRTSHIITQLERRNDAGKKLIYGEADILDTPDGRVIETLFRAGARIGISSRGEGSVKHDSDKNVDIVQNDYRPEAFDFVTKPSTIGAYPEALTESEVQENSKVVLKALSKLIEDTQDKKILLSCLRTLEEYRGDDEGRTLVESLETKLTEELPKPAPVEPAPSSPSNNPEPKPEEDTMDKDKLSKEAWEDLQQMVKDLSAQKTAELEASFKTKEESNLTNIADLTKRLEDTTKKLEAAEKIIDAYGDKVKDMQTTPTEAQEDTEKRLEAAKKIIEACMKMLGELREAKTYGEAAEKVVQALLDKGGKDKVDSFLDTVVGGIEDKDKKEAIKKLVGSCGTLDEAKERLDALKSILPVAERRRVSREPLPGNSDGTLTEEQLNALVEDRVSSKRPTTLAGKLYKRCATPRRR